MTARQKQYKLKKLYDFDEYLKASKRLAVRLEKIISIIISFKNRGKVLDIGGGFGLFGSMMSKEPGYDVEILEPYNKVMFDEKLRVHKMDIDDFFRQSKKKYDIVCAMDVVEHFDNPINALGNMKKQMNKKAMIVIQVPNYQSLMAWLCRHWSWWMVEDHKYMFSPKSLKLLLKKTGYHIRFFMTYEDFYDLKKNLDGNFTGIKNNIFRKLVKGIYFGLFTPLYFMFRRAIWRFGYGGLIFCIADPV